MEFMFQLELCGLTTRTFYALTLASLESMEVLYNVLIVTNTWNSNMDKLPRSHVLIWLVGDSIHKHRKLKTVRLAASNVMVGYNDGGVCLINR